MICHPFATRVVKSKRNEYGHSILIRTLNPFEKKKKWILAFLGLGSCRYDRTKNLNYCWRNLREKKKNTTTTNAERSNTTYSRLCCDSIGKRLEIRENDLLNATIAPNVIHSTISVRGAYCELKVISQTSEIFYYSILSTPNVRRNYSFWRETGTIGNEVFQYSEITINIFRQIDVKRVVPFTAIIRYFLCMHAYYFHAIFFIDFLHFFSINNFNCFRCTANNRRAYCSYLDTRR